MEKIEKWKELGNNLNRKLFEFTKQAFRNYDKEIIKNTHNQLDKGIDGENRRLSPYSIPYAKKRQIAGLQILNKDLKFSGDFRNKFYVLGFENFVEMGSRHRLDEILGSNYGEEIYKLTDENMKRFINMFLKPVIWRGLQKK